MLKPFACFILTSSSFITYAQESSFSIGAQLGYGGQEFKVEQGNKISGDEFIYGLNGRYVVNKRFGVEIGYLNGFEGIASILLTPISQVKNLEFSGARLALYGQYPIIGNLYTNASAGLIYNRLSYTINDTDRDKNASGTYLSAGLSYQFDLGLELELSGIYMPTNRLELTAVQAGINVRF